MNSYSVKIIQLASGEWGYKVYRNGELVAHSLCIASEETAETSALAIVDAMKEEELRSTVVYSRSFDVE